ncbi:MAG: L-rhamnonate dehydratase [Chloroflexota bacterium]|nr:L-rhamnonate dehydratase [Chloroflexota bacterium]
MKRATIVDVRAYVNDASSGADYHFQPRGHWIIDTPIANPMSIYEGYKDSRVSWGINALGGVIVEVELEDGRTGVGISTGGEPACFIIERHLKRFLVGQSPRDVEVIWDQMWRATLPYGRKGLAIHAISAVDLALWDLLGKLRDEPVYALLGGATKDKLPMYATTIRPDLAQELGFHGAKLPLMYGPAEGIEGLRKNVALMEQSRASVGPDFRLMFDCYMSLTVPYAIELAKALEPYDVYWLEECLPPDDTDGCAELKASVSSCLFAGGEHEYTRYGYRELIARACFDILQPDLTWVGGMTEARRIVAMASAYDIPVIPHGSGIFAYHLQYAFTNCPMAEFLMMSPAADEIIPIFGDIFIDEPLPQGGYLRLPDKPGWGVELNRAGLNLRRLYAED